MTTKIKIKSIKWIYKLNSENNSTTSVGLIKGKKRVGRQITPGAYGKVGLKIDSEFFCRQVKYYIHFFLL